MKRIIIAIAFVFGSVQVQHVLANGNKDAVVQNVMMTYAEEIELLKDYIPKIDTTFLDQVLNIQVYDQDYKLKMEGNVLEYGDIENIELRNLVNESDFITRIDNQVIYVISK